MAGRELSKRDLTKLDTLMLTSELAREAQKRIKYLTLELGGHNKRGSVVDSYIRSKAADLRLK